MSRVSTLILIGILTMLVPFSGLPISIRTFLTVLFGACIFGIGFSLRARQMKEKAEEQPTTHPENPPTISSI